MADHFEKAKDRILKRAAENGGPTIGDLFDAQIATNDDLDEARKEQTDLLKDHIKEDKARAKSVEDDLQRWQQQQAERCAAEHERLFGRQPHRCGDPADSDYTKDSSRIETASEAETSRQRFTKEQIVTAIVIFLATISTNAVVVWVIVRSLEEAAK